MQESGHEEKTFTNFKGMWDRGDIEKCPPDHVSDCLNMFVKDGNYITRPGITTKNIVSGLFSGIATIFPYKGTTTASNGYIIGDHTGRFWHVSAALGTTTLLGGGGGDGLFSGLQIGTRFYLMPYSGGATPGFELYVWDFSWIALGKPMRLAGGLASTAGPMTFTVTGAGKIERGVHIFTVAYETDTGFLTKASTSAAVAAGLAGAVTGNLTVIPTGPVGTSARVILVTKSILRYNNDVNNQEYFILPGGRIPDNVTTFLNGINFYDADLQESADYLFDQLEKLPNCRSLGYYNNRLVLVSDSTDRDVIRISKAGEPESFDAVDGFIDTVPETVRGVEDVCEQNGILYIFKFGRTLFTQDNGDVPSTWPVESVSSDKVIMPGDPAVFTSPGDSICKLGGYPATIDDKVLVACLDGVYTFTSGFGEELTWKISNFWKSFTSNGVAAFLVDTYNKRMFIRYSATGWLVGDYTLGLDSKNIIWTRFSTSFNINANSLLVDEINKVSWLLFASNLNDKEVFTLVSSNQHDYVGSVAFIATSIVQTLKFPPIYIEDDWMHHISGATVEMDDQSAAAGLILFEFRWFDYSIAGVNYQARTFNTPWARNQLFKYNVVGYKMYPTLAITPVLDSATIVNKVVSYIKKLYRKSETI